MRRLTSSLSLSITSLGSELWFRSSSTIKWFVTSVYTGIHRKSLKYRSVRGPKTKKSFEHTFFKVKNLDLYYGNLNREYYYFISNTCIILKQLEIEAISLYLLQLLLLRIKSIFTGNNTKIGSNMIEPCSQVKKYLRLSLEKTWKNLLSL